ncbi:MAG: phosphoribosylformylglycinamidine cyclo-ligase, partial [Bacteroidota bacterium]|nr:phosphoribosylformylglycinamidine cyclo-ligase [Bacteroidota bacterium]
MSYEKRGVSATKSEVHAAISKLDKGLYPNAFCKILPDMLSGDPAYCTIMHADTAGTKPSLAYMYWKETGDLSVWKGIAQDALVMNLDDMACAGAVENIVISSTIGRNKHLVPGEVLKALIEGTVEILDWLTDLGINIQHAGGETADVGDIVRTLDVGFTAFARLRREEVLKINVRPGDVIVGLASYGQASYESEYNSGIGSNGLTFARHEALSHKYAGIYPETFDPNTDKKFIYSGKMSLTDTFEDALLNAGRLLLSPTRTYLPFLCEVLKEDKAHIRGIVHNTGGGQTKIKHFISRVDVVKDNLHDLPPVFKMIQAQKNADWKEMYQVFNMGGRLELYTDSITAFRLLALAK